MDPNLPTQTTQDLSINSKKKSGKFKKILGLVFLFLIIAAVPITIFSLRQQQQTKSGASTVVSEDTVVATINGEDVTKADLRKVAEEQYDPVAVDNTALMVALDVVTERKILDSEVKNGSISASDEEVAEVMKDAALDQKSAYYQVLINKATLLYTKARQALTIGFWLPPQETVTTYSDADKAENATQLSDGLAAMDEAKTRIGTGEDILTIAQSLSTKYPSIASILAINGYILSDSGQNLEAISQPRIYEVDQTESGSVLSTALFSSTLNVGDVQEVSGEDQSGETVIKLLEKNDSAQFDTYKDWLDSKKSQLVVLKNPLQ